MDYIEKHDLLMRIAQFIRLEKTGGLEEFAQKCNIKKDRLFDCIDVLRQIIKRNEANILYDKDRETYYFSPSGKFIDSKFVADN